MKVRFGLRLKLFIIFILFASIMVYTLTGFIRERYREHIINMYEERLGSIVDYASGIINGDKVVEFSKTLEATEEYEHIIEELSGLKYKLGGLYLYVIMPVDDEHGIYIYEAELTKEESERIGITNNKLGTPVDFEGVYSVALNTMVTQQVSSELDVVDEIVGNITQTIGSMYAPVIDSKGKSVAFVGVDMDISEMNSYINSALEDMIRIIAIVISGCFLILMMVLQVSIIMPVKRLKAHVDMFAAGVYNRALTVYGNDEISIISRAFNAMADKIGSHIKEINYINEAYEKFLPSELFGLLGKSSVTEIKLGNQADRKAAIMYFGIPSFYDMIKKLGTEEVLGLVNSVLGNAVPEVVETGGVIEKFEESGFNAFYLNDTEQCLSGAVSICRRLNNLDLRNSIGLKGDIRCGIGITYGDFRMGIMGNEKRFSVVSVSENTKISDFLKKISSGYGSNILITAKAAAQIDNFESRWHSRFIGFIHSDETGRAIKVYDVFDGDSEEIFYLKLQTREEFERGVNLYCAGNIQEARTCFVNVLRRFRKDGAAREYLFKCNLENTDNKTDIYIEHY